MLLFKKPLPRLAMANKVGGLLAMAIVQNVHATGNTMLMASTIAKIQHDASPDYAVQGELADNAAQAWRIQFNQNGVQIGDSQSTQNHALTLRLSRIGTSQQLVALSAVKPKISKNRISYARDGVEEWYVNGPLGLEQGFNVPRPMGRDLVLEVATNWQAVLKGGAIQLDNGTDQWHIGALEAVDAIGQVLPSKMAVVGGKVHIHVDTQTAHFPVSIDPLFTRKATLMAKDQTKFLGFGRSVAISGDGNTAIVGSDNNTAYIYKRNPAGWVQAQKLTKPKGLRCNGNGSWFGWSVALSKDGSTAMVGASGIFVLYSGIIPIHLFYSCADLPVYKKRGNQWVLEKILTTPAVNREAMFGSSISLSLDGNRAVVGAQKTKCAANAHSCGAVYMFERASKGWMNQKRFVNPITYDAQSGFFGATTAISGNGSWALVGAPGGDTAWVFQRMPPPVGWKQVQSLKFPPNRLTKDFGTALALSTVGNIALISAESTTNDADCKGDYNDCGAVYYFARQGSKWLLKSSFTANDSHSYNYFGESLALSGNGNRAVIGTSFADCINGNCGAAYVFDRVGARWVQAGRTTGPSAGLGGSDLGGYFGGAVSLSQNAVNLLVAAREENCPAGKQCGKVYDYLLGR